MDASNFLDVEKYKKLYFSELKVCNNNRAIQFGLLGYISLLRFILLFPSYNALYKMVNFFQVIGASVEDKK